MPFALYDEDGEPVNVPSKDVDQIISNYNDLISFIAFIANKVADLRRLHKYEPSYCGWNADCYDFIPTFRDNINGNKIILNWRDRDNHMQEFSMDHKYIFMEWENIEKEELSMIEKFNKIKKQKDIRASQNRLEELIRQKSYVDNEISKLKTSLENVN